jgi:hypothetical protein
MICVTLIGHDGQTTTPQELLTAAELHEAADKARNLARECENLMRLKTADKFGKPQRSAPYST